MWPCERLDAIDSTQRELQRRLARAFHAGTPPDEPFAVWTTHQTEGIGSHGRRWQDASQGLALSVAWPETICGSDQAAWPVRLSLLVMSALESMYPRLVHRLGVKWPNDIMCGRHKLAGVLVSRHLMAGQPWLIAGVGINLAWHASPPVDRPVTSLQALGVQAIDVEKLVGVLCERISRLWTERPDQTVWRDEFERRDVHYMQRVSVVHPLSGKLLHEGVAEGISGAGELKLRVGEELYTIQIGEVSLRAQYAGIKESV